MVDTQGFPHAIAVTPANVIDGTGGLMALAAAGEDLFGVRTLLVDGGYTGERFATAVDTLLGTDVEVVKRNELSSFVVMPKRWIVERSFGWLDKCGRLWKNCERHLSTSRSMLQLTFLAILLKRL